MKSKVLSMILIAVSVMSVTAVASAQQLLIATGGKGGTYSRMYEELSAVCKDSGLQLLEKNTTGSVENVDLMLNNQVNGALLQEDVLRFRARTDTTVPLEVRQLFGMNQEEIHLITRAAGRQVGGFGIGGFHIGGSQVVLRDFRDMQGRVAGAVGGSVITAKMFAANSGVDFKVQEFQSNQAALDALKAGQIDVVFMVMGAPASLVEKLDSSYRLLPIDGSPEDKLKDYYTPTHLTYTNLEDSQGVPALAVQDIFAVRDYKTPEMVAGLHALKACFLKELPELKETLGTHPKWQQVDPNVSGRWPMYNH